MIYKTLLDGLSFKYCCKQQWRLISAALISRNSVSASWKPLPWLQDSTSGIETAFIRSKAEIFMDVPSLPLTGEWPWQNSLWWCWEFIDWQIPTRCSFRVTCPSQLRTFLIWQLLKGAVLDPPAQENSAPSSASSFCCRGGWSSFPSSWLLPGSNWKAARALQATAASEDGVKGRVTKGREITSNLCVHVQPAFPLTIQIPKTRQPCRWYQQVLQDFLPKPLLRQAHTEIWYLLVGKIENHWRLGNTLRYI